MYFRIIKRPKPQPSDSQAVALPGEIMKRFDKNGNTAAVCLTARQCGHPRLKTGSGHGTAGMATIAGHRLPRPCCTPEPTKNMVAAPVLPNRTWPVWRND